MREILFRGKTIKQNDGVTTGNPIKENMWVYGNLTVGKIEGYKCDMISNKKEIYYINSETIGQFTGLTDKNGKKIFEGDIIRLTPPKESGEIYIPTPRNPQEDRILKVIFFDGMFAVDMSKWFKYGHGKVALQTYETNRIEIIGNIYDNPELLEV